MEPRTFITALATARHLFLSETRLIHSTPFLSTFLRFILILFPHLRQILPNGLFASGSLTETLYTIHFSAVRATWPAHPNPFYHCNILPAPLSLPARATRCSAAPSACGRPILWQTKFHTHIKQQQILIRRILINLHIFAGKQKDKTFWTVCPVQSAALH